LAIAAAWEEAALDKFDDDENTANALIGAFFDYTGQRLNAQSNDDDFSDWLDECYQGVHDSKAEWAEEHLSSTGDLAEIPQHLRQYFDFNAYAEAQETGGIDFIEVGRKVHVITTR
jgi:antirestriction protein